VFWTLDANGEKTKPEARGFPHRLVVVAACLEISHLVTVFMGDGHSGTNAGCARASAEQNHATVARAAARHVPPTVYCPASLATGCVQGRFWRGGEKRITGGAPLSRSGLERRISPQARRP
jgi:hypothetical protein